MDYKVRSEENRMRSMSATEFARNFAQIQHDVRTGAVEVMSHSRVTGYFVSPEDFAEFEALRAKARRSLLAGNLPEETVKALKKTKMDKRHTMLNALMQD
jgi:hypothetical protein